MNDQPDDKKRNRILGIVRNLMARTVENGATEAEANEAAAKVDALMAEYEIDLTEATVADQEMARVDVALANHPVRYAAMNLATFTDTRVWTEPAPDGKDYICFLGMEIDTQIAEYLLLLFQRAIDRELRDYSMFTPEIALSDAAGVKGMVMSFQIGMATRLGDRLLQLKSKRDLTQRVGRFDLVLAKKPLVDEAFATLGITLEAGGNRGQTITHHGAYAAGQSAGDKVSINAGVGSSRAAMGRIR